MSTILVTGACGFLGVPSVDALVARGFEVHGVSRRAHESSGVVRWHAVDLLDDTAVTDLCRTVRPTHLLHQAWTTEHGRFWHSRDNLDWTAATLRLFRAFADAGGTRFVGVGSAAEYGDQDGPCSEEHSPMRPTSLYGIAKHATHSVLAAVAANTGIEFSWARVFQPYGPGEPADRLVPSVSAMLLAGREPSCNNGAHVRDFMHVRDVGRALAALVASSVAGAVNIGTGRATSVADVVSLLGDLAGRPDLVRAVERAGKSGDAGISPEIPSILVADITRLTRDVGYRPELDLRTGLADALDWWRAKAAP